MTNLPLSGVSATLTKVGFSESGVTGQGFLGQTDWFGGGGQATSTNATMYLASDGNLETQDPVGDVLLKKVFSDYVHNGVLRPHPRLIQVLQVIFNKQIWTPVDQPVDVGDPNVRIQIATNNDGSGF